MFKKKLITREFTREKSHPVRPLGMDRGSVIVSDDFDAPLPPEIMAHFLEGSETPQAKSSKKPTVSKRQRVSSRK
jgi:hypothetical protein